jgi:hypothetical protein
MTITKKFLDIIEYFVSFQQNHELLDLYFVNEILENLMTQAKIENLVIIEQKINDLLKKII